MSIECTFVADGPAVLSAIPTVFVVDSDAALREALDVQIRSAGWQPELFASAEAFLDRPRTLAPGCLLVELCLPGASGLDLQRLVSDRPEMPVIFMSSRVDIPSTVQAMKAGAMEFLTKPCSPDALEDAIRAAIEVSHAVLPRSAHARAVGHCYQLLSSREREVMGLVVAGRLNKQVSAELGISEVTVKVHRGRMMRKMQAASFAELVRMAAALKNPPPAAFNVPPIETRRRPPFDYTKVYIQAARGTASIQAVPPFLRSSSETKPEHRAPAATQHPY